MFKKNSNKRMMAKAGSLYLTLILTGVFAHLFVRANLIEPGNAEVTAQNILNNRFIFRLGFVLDLTYMVSFIFLGLTFYRMFQLTDRKHARTLLSIVLVSNAMMGLNMLNQFAAQYVLSGADYLNVFQPGQLQALSLFFLDLHSHGIHIGYLFFGLWLLPLGQLILKADLFPGVLGRITGILLLVGFVGYQIDFLSYFLFPDYYSFISAYATIPADFGEILLCLWLLIKGADGNEKQRAAFAKLNHSI